MALVSSNVGGREWHAAHHARAAPRQAPGTGRPVRASMSLATPFACRGGGPGWGSGTFERGARAGASRSNARDVHGWTRPVADVVDMVRWQVRCRDFMKKKRVTRSLKSRPRALGARRSRNALSAPPFADYSKPTAVSDIWTHASQNPSIFHRCDLAGLLPISATILRHRCRKFVNRHSFCTTTAPASPPPLARGRPKAILADVPRPHETPPTPIPHDSPAPRCPNRAAQVRADTILRRPIPLR
ncbi:hypothetical protein HYPSUDRAFT_374963 [Hypholoma sublateritium FD-334 SS-4]|uniref:Uncharacterized protein n=1 Tax=Hypholoma sublateritium (strain FD-334 SS-4) TaxID=945553 RepID=A0A0D2LE51_HYPSF|nr:hypothetical protein HYPSUDRAFT_374963 [Hypholoma sublateritium FD-334 SS-4]